MFPSDNNDELFRPGRMFAVVDVFVNADDNGMVPCCVDLRVDISGNATRGPL